MCLAVCLNLLVTVIEVVQVFFLKPPLSWWRCMCDYQVCEGVCVSTCECVGGFQPVPELEREADGRSLEII